eukprot:713648_1
MPLLFLLLHSIFITSQAKLIFLPSASITRDAASALCTSSGNTPITNADITQGMACADTAKAYSGYGNRKKVFIGGSGYNAIRISYQTSTVTGVSDKIVGVCCEEGAAAPAKSPTTPPTTKTPTTPPTDPTPHPTKPPSKATTKTPTAPPTPPTTATPTSSPVIQVCSTGSYTCGDRITGTLSGGGERDYVICLRENREWIKFNGCKTTFDCEQEIYRQSQVVATGRDGDQIGIKYDDATNMNRVECNHKYATDLEIYGVDECTYPAGGVPKGEYPYRIRGWMRDTSVYGTFDIEITCGPVIELIPYPGYTPINNNARIRKPWLEMTQDEKNLYIFGFYELTKRGVIQDFSIAHQLVNEHGTSEFLPWHRQFLYILEEEYRKLSVDYAATNWIGQPEYAYYAIPYWNWSEEPNQGDTQYPLPGILDCGLGGDGDVNNGQCVVDNGNHFGKGAYTPSWTGATCLQRSANWGSGKTDCDFVNYATIMDAVDTLDDYATFAPWLEGTPHARPHNCFTQNMASLNSPDDPIFYLHHSFLDFIYALWQDCHNFDLAMNEEQLRLAYAGDVGTCLVFERLTLESKYGYPPTRVAETLDIHNSHGVSYERGNFWNNGRVEAKEECVNDINVNWFIDTNPIRRRLPNDENTPKHIQKQNEVYDKIVKKVKNDPKNRGKSPGEIRKIITHRWAKEFCEEEEQRTGKKHPPPLPGYDACDNLEINRCTNDIDITKDKLLELAAAGGQTDEMLEIIENEYLWHKSRGELKYLCRGCYVEFCDKTFLKGRCGDSGGYDDRHPQHKGAVNPNCGAGGGHKSNANADGENIMVFNKEMNKGYSYENMAYKFMEMSWENILIIVVSISLFCNVIYAIHCVYKKRYKMERYEKFEN